MAFLKLKIPKQDCVSDRWLNVEDDTVIITPIASFYKIGLISYWVLSPQGLTFTRGAVSFSSLKLRKDNTAADLTLEVSYTNNDTKQVSGKLKVGEMEFVSELPREVRVKLN